MKTRSWAKSPRRSSPLTACSRPVSKPVRLKRWLFLALAALFTPLALVAYVQVATLARSFGNSAAVPAEPVAIVFGAGIRGEDDLSPMLADRVQAAVDLYRAGRVHKLLMTGDNSSLSHDEVSPMRRFAIAHGVPSEDIRLDYAGFSTYDSCYRARVIFGVTRAVVVTQRFHLSRALYTCLQLGVDAVGLGTPDWGVYSDGLMSYYSLRESLATLKALWELHITRPPPTFLGSFEGI
jgi:vancomycin permeability regulator SanA